MLCIRGTSRGPVSVSVSLCLSVSVCLSQVGVLLKRLNVGSHKKTPHDSTGTLVFLKPKISAKFDRGHPRTGAPNAGGVGQNRRLLTNNRLYLKNGTR